jgi:predicted metal-dependent hydrolase
VTARDAAQSAVDRGVRLFNRGRYFAAQQVWETTWRDAAPEVRSLLEGLVQLAGGLHLRTRRGATRGAVHLISQALVTLEDHRPGACGIDVDMLIADFGAYVDWLKGVDRPHRLLDRLRIPRIRGTSG